MSWIEVSRASDGAKMYINTDNIIRIIPMKTGSELQTVVIGGDGKPTTIQIKEDPQKVISRIKPR
jgi:hypothetical protein